MEPRIRRRIGTAGALVLALAGLAGCEATLSPSERVFFTIDDVVIGTGELAVPGDWVTIRYVAWLWEEDGPDRKGQQVDSGELEFVLGVDQVLSGLRGGPRQHAGRRACGACRCRPSTPSGGRGVGNIPPNSTLVIEMELLAVRPYVTDSAPFQVIDLREGDGETALNGYVLTVVYAGWLYDASRPDGKGRQFEVNNQGFSFSLGLGQVLEGWEEGLVGMRENGERRLIIPPEMAYGETGARPRIPPNATLVFDVTLNSVRIP